VFKSQKRSLERDEKIGVPDEPLAINECSSLKKDAEGWSPITLSKLPQEMME
jgi:hypothetical protein